MFEKYLTKTGRLSPKQPQEIKNQWYIQKFREVHGDKYDYSKVVYTYSKEQVEIVCREHGSFFQTPNYHLKGQDCPKCQSIQKEKRAKTIEQCLEDFKRVHSSTYDYSKVSYVNSYTKVEIICKEHGSFLQTPTLHLKGQGCSQCYGNKKKDTKQCIEDFKKVHGDTYDYSRVQYVRSKDKVEIICKEHGSFLQTPNDHLTGHGCPKCQVSNQNILYVLKCLYTGLIKIGITNNLNKRISSIGGNLEYLYHVIVDNPRKLEKLLHSNYQNYNRFNATVLSGNTEFFQLSEQQVQEVIHYLESVQQGEF